MIDGEAVRACTLPVSGVSEGQEIVTIEGLSADDDHPLQQAWAELDVPQCGYCQPGIIMAAAALLADKPNPIRCRDRRRRHQHLPLRHLQPRAPGHPPGRRDQARGAAVMSKRTHQGLAP
jgi:aerobic-type carbon monoxide dehydrogenase small subunit (CoxS/CutS family)